MRSIEADRLVHMCKHMANCNMDVLLEKYTDKVLGDSTIVTRIPDNGGPRKLWFIHSTILWKFEACLAEVYDGNRTDEVFDMGLAFRSIAFDVVEPPRIENGCLLFKLNDGMAFMQELKG